jgi:hypothetical protein
MEMTREQISVQAASPRRGTPRRIRSIAINTFRESVRDRVLYNLILFVLVLVGASVFVSELSIDQETITPTSG